MSLRRDALCGAAAAILALRDAGRARDDITTNVGIISAEPGGFNVVPGASEFTIDVRSATEDGYATLEPLVRDTLGRIAEEQGLELEINEAYRLTHCLWRLNWWTSSSRLRPPKVQRLGGCRAAPATTRWRWGATFRRDAVRTEPAGNQPLA